MRMIRIVGIGVFPLHLDLEPGFDTAGFVSTDTPQASRNAYMSSGYTRALASTAPVAPATALPQGGRGFEPSDM